MLVAGIFRLIDSIKAFPLIFVLTDGGPGDVTEVTNYYAYRQAFTFSLWGYGSAIATLMVIGIFVLSWAIDRLTRAADAEAGLRLRPGAAARSQPPALGRWRHAVATCDGVISVRLASPDVVPTELRHSGL